MVRILVLSFAVLLASCGSKAPAGKRYQMEGKILALDASSKTATIDAGQIGDWMAPMTMEYPVKPDSEFQKLRVGDRIQATVVVNDPQYYVTDVKPAPFPAAHP